jgi:3-oxoacyl-[acyl-carrier protein] reductase
MNLRLENKLALVTASSGGEGARVIINGLSEKSVNTAISSIREVNPESSEASFNSNTP